MVYKGFSASMEFGAEDGCFIGHIADISDIVGFHAETADGLQQAFHEAVDDYLDTLKTLDRDTMRDHYDFSNSMPNPYIHRD